MPAKQKQNATDKISLPIFVQELVRRALYFCARLRPKSKRGKQFLNRDRDIIQESQKIQEIAVQNGFDWPDYLPVIEKILEEIEEVKSAVISKNKEHISEEIGDLFFCVLNLARKLNIDPEESLSNANKKFCARFEAMKKIASENGQNFASLNLDEQEKLWQQVKVKK